MTSARIIGPVMAPFALQAATATRGWLDERRARQLGVTAIEVAAYRGPTGPTEARLAGLAQTVQELQRRRGGDLQVVRFAEVTNNRLADLTIATRAAASMPSGRRRATLLRRGPRSGPDRRRPDDVPAAECAGGLIDFAVATDRSDGSVAR